MTLKIYFNEEKTSSQTIHMSEKSLESAPGKKKSPNEIVNMCRGIASDLAHGGYNSIVIDN